MFSHDVKGLYKFSVQMIEILLSLVDKLTVCVTLLGLGHAEVPSLWANGCYWVYGYHGRKADLLYLHLLFIQVSGPTCDIWGALFH